MNQSLGIMKNVLLEETRKISQAVPLLGMYSEQDLNSDLSFKGNNDGDISYNKNGVQFYGEMRNRKITGNGELMFKHSFFGNLLYKGDFSKNQPNGYGEFNIGDQKIFKGNFKQSKIEGIGILNDEDYIYQGQWKDSSFNGYGRIVKKNFSLYEGQFYKNKRDGLGIEIYQNSDLYLGEFKQDEKQGLGIYLFQKGGYYYGFFHKGQRHGFGTLYDKNLSIIYYGFWKEDQKHSRGVEIYPNGSKYDGYFENNQRNGVGCMEYSASLLYIGEWKNGMRCGQGKVELGKKNLIGIFYEDQLISVQSVLTIDVAEQMLQESLPADMQSYLQLKKYNLGKGIVRGSHNLHNIIKITISTYVLNLVKSGILRLKLFVIVKNLFQQIGFEELLNEIQVQLKFHPNVKQLNSFWEIQIEEIFNQKKYFDWIVWDMQKQKQAQLFGVETDKENQDFYNLVLTEKKKNYQLQISNQIIKGENKKYIIEGVADNFGYDCRFFDNKEEYFKKNIRLEVYPYFIQMKSLKKQKVQILSQKIVRYQGKFYFGQNQNQNRDLIMYLSFDNLNNIYTVGIDSVGSFIIVGEVNKKQATGKFTQIYHENYRINYDAFLFNGDKIQGYWKTTNLNGQFVLRKDKKFKFEKKIQQFIQKNQYIFNINESKDLNAIEEIREDLEYSILSVVVKQKQGGIVKPQKPVKGQNNLSLFKKYKKNIKKKNSKIFNFNQDKLQEIEKKLLQDQEMVEETFFRNSQDQNNEQSEDIDKTQITDMLTDLVQVNFENNNQEMLRKKTQHLPEQLKPYELNSKISLTKQDRFKEKLSNALKTLKQVNKKYTPYNINNYSLEEESINWLGIKNTLGKEERIVINNLYIMQDRIEGLFIDQNEIVYELAGSCSYRTKVFEIIGLSIEKTKTLKIQGHLDGFYLKGNLSFKPIQGADAAIEIKMNGQNAKANLKFQQKQIFEKVEAIVQIGEKYIFAIIHYDNKYIQIVGFREFDRPFYIEVNSNIKDHKKLNLVQILFNDDENEQIGKDKPLYFFDQEYSLEIIFEQLSQQIYQLLICNAKKIQINFQVKHAKRKNHKPKP